MRKILLPMLGCLIAFCGYTQDVVSWSFSAKKTADKTYEIHLAATVGEDWHIYSQFTPEGGPLPTKITFTKNPLVIFQDKIKEKGVMERYHDKTFDVDVYAYSGKVDFVQVIKLKNNVKTTLNGFIEFMACTKERCLAPEKKLFNVMIP